MNMQSQLKALDTLRGNISDLHAERLELVHESLSKDETHARIDNFVESQAASVSEQIGNFARQSGQPSDWLVLTEDSTIGHGITGVNVAPWHCLLGPEEIKAKLKKFVDSYGIEFGRPTPERRERQQAISDQILELEMQEESAIRLLTTNAHPVARRNDIENPIVLALRLDVLDNTATAQKKAA